VGNNHIAHKSGADAKRSPILVGYVGNLIIYDVQTTANLATVRRIVRLVSLERLRRETSDNDAVSCDVIERAADDVSAFRCPFVVDSRRAEMRERTFFETDSACRLNDNG
jgi:hypothetical protein